MSALPSSDWIPLIEAVTNAVTSKNSMLKHIYDGDSHFIFKLLEKTCKREPLVLRENGRIYQLEVGRIHIERPLHFNHEQNVSAPAYPYHARWGEYSYCASTKCDFIFKILSDPQTDATLRDIDDILAGVMDETIPHGRSSEPSCPMPSVIDVNAFTINIGELYVLVRGDLCRLKGTGMLCNEDPEIEGGYHIYNGAEKFTESQFVQRSNHCYVHFLNSSTSASQSATAVEATDSNSTTADSHVLLQCDFRPSDDDIQRTYSAFHMLMVVDKPQHARQMIQKHLQARHFNAEGHFTTSSPTSPLEASKFPFLKDITQVGLELLGMGEVVTISFPNMDELTFNLVMIMFLLGLNNRLEMIKCIIPDEHHMLHALGLLLEDGSIATGAFDLAQKDPLLHHTIVIYYSVYTLLHNQSVFMPSDTVDPAKIYYASSERVTALPFDHIPGTYEYIVEHYIPLIGLKESNFVPHKEQFTNSELAGENFVRQYHEAMLDGWDRAAILAHVTKVIHVHGSRKRQKSKSDPTGHVVPANGGDSIRPTIFKKKVERDYGRGKQSMPRTKTLPDKAESDRLQKTLERFMNSFHEELLPHLGTTSDWAVVVAKRTMLGFMVKKMVLVAMGYLSPDQQDNLEMKECEVVGQMMARAWAVQWQKNLMKLFDRIVSQYRDPKPMASRGKKQMRSSKSRKDRQSSPNQPINWQSLAASCFPLSPFTGPMDCGVWPRAGATVMDVKGSTKRLQYANVASFLSAMRCVHTVTNKKGGSRMKDSPAQQVDNSHYQRFCPLDTDNAKNAGIDLNLALGSEVRVGYSRSEILSVILQGARETTTSPFFNHFNRLHDAPVDACASDLGVVSVPPASVAIFINGSLVGFTFEPFKTMKALRLARRHHFLAYDIGITWVNGPVGNDCNVLRNPFFNYIQISGSWGAVLSPFLDMSNMHKLPKIVEKHSSMYGIYPNVAARATQPHLDPSGNYDINYPAGDYCLERGMLFDALINEGVLVYRDPEETAQECIAASFRDITSVTTTSLQTSPHLSINRMDVANIVRSTCMKNPASRLNQCDEEVPIPKNYSLSVISESLMLGVAASTTPFVNADDACRASYATGMLSQSTGSAPLNLKFKKNIYHMYMLEPKTSLAPTTHSKLFSFVGAGNAAIPSLTCFYSHGDNGEDAVLRTTAPTGRYHVTHIGNKSASANYSTTSPESGNHHNGENMVHLASSSSSSRNKGGDSRFANAKKIPGCLTLKSTDYSKLSDDGIPLLGAAIKPGAALISRVFKVGAAGSTVRDGTFVNGSRMTVHVDRRTITINKDGLRNYVLRTSTVRVQTAGDKTSSSHGQKGTATLIRTEEAPYTRDVFKRALRPHLYRQPHGVPSRTTQGEQRETLHAQISTQSGSNIAVNCWEEHMNLFDALDKVPSNMLEYGIMNPETGLPLLTPASVGVIDYRMMRHLARETFNSRALGAVEPKTKQPTQGSKRKGGGREGPLEALNKISQGATDVWQQLLFTGSDPGFAHICTKCGLLAASSPPKALYAQSVPLAMAASQASFSDPNNRILAETARQAHHFSSQLLNSQGGVIHSKNLSVPLNPSGGWCSVCMKSDHVFRVPMAHVSQHIIEYGYLSGQSWRFVTNAAHPIVPEPPTVSKDSASAKHHLAELDAETGRLRIPIADFLNFGGFNNRCIPDSPQYDPL